MNNKVVLFNKCEKKCFIVVYLIIMCSFFSCSNLLMNNELAHVEEDKISVTFFINMGFSGNRTILPASFNGDFRYVIEGRSTRGETVKEVLKPYVAEGEVALSKTVWELTLKLYENNENNSETGDLLMQDTIIKDFATDDSNVVFVLSDKRVSTAQGGCNLTLNFADISDGVNSVNVELLDLCTGKKIENTISTYKNENISRNDNGTKSINYKLDNISQGQYILDVSFYNSDSELIVVWCNILCISPGITTESEINIPENYIGSKPVAPIDFTAEVKGNSVKLSWEYNSGNETQFNIYVYDNTDKLIETYYAFAGETSYTLVLESGTYKIGISAKNKIGESEKIETSIEI